MAGQQGNKMDALITAHKLSSYRVS